MLKNKEQTTKENTDYSIESSGKILTGVVVSDKMQKTVVVKVSRFIKHPKYQKYYKTDSKYKAHDELNTYHVGDKVQIRETRPLSKDKSFIVIGLSNTL